MNCPLCGNEISETNVFCPSCGTKLPQPEPAAPETPHCPVCGLEVSAKDAFCVSCGAKLQQPAEETPAEPAPAEANPVEEVPVTEAPVMEAPAPPTPAEAPQAAQTPPQQNFRDPFGPSTGEVQDAAPVRPFFEDNLAPIVKTSSWFGTISAWVLIPLALMILGEVGAFFIPGKVAITLPALGLILGGIYALVFLFVMAFSKRINPSKRNFFRAYLLWMLILLVLYIVLILLVIFLAPGIMESLTGFMASGMPYNL